MRHILYAAAVLALQICFTCAIDVVAPHNNLLSGFVKVKDGHFSLNNSNFRFYGTNAYWIQMTTDEDMEITFHDIAKAGYTVVRTWAFNDVVERPASGTYFQVLNKRGARINEGSDGLRRLDKAISIAEKYGIRLLLSLTNNWNPERTMPSSSWNRRQNTNGLPRGYLSNDYGGMDAYVRAFYPQGTHDLFYTDRAIVDSFKRYVGHIVKRYANSPTVLGWELGNDLRCSSTLPASSNCNTATITRWTAALSSYIKTIDRNHIITAGDGGFYCLTCPKIYAKEFTGPSPSLPGSTFDGSYGVDTEDILAVPSIDFGSFQLFPDQIQYFPAVLDDSFATNSIGDGGKWVVLHSNTAAKSKKPEVLTAVSIISKEDYGSFAPFNSTSQIPDGTPCGGVESFQVDYALTAWAGAALNGGVDGVLEYQWQQDGLTSQLSQPTLGLRRRGPLTKSPQDGSARYKGPANGQNAAQFAKSRPAI